ncbi:deoxyhypusine hydroxylase [Blastocladiella emersonii ATCC 22665]|nr:deoxyhypusine hydroxylase [Blastocladiella emersonii ATCC 22665]
MAVDYDFPSGDAAIEAARNDPATVQRLGAALLDKVLPMAERFRALFTLKALKTADAIDAIGKGFADESALLKHELAYVLGQMKLPAAIPVLSSVLETEGEDPMVRHEAAEALGAIGDASVIPLLQRYRDDAAAPVEVRETCELALDLLQWEGKDEGKRSESAYASVDPAPPLPIDEASDVPRLRAILLDASLPLFKRYRAMFSLRNLGNEEAVLALADGFGDKSALFRHEIAYVFGQLQHPASVPSLSKVLMDASEQGMVRHEAAEALGSIGTPECLPLLQKFAQDSDAVVRESCVVGVDMWEYENSGELQYANGLQAGH